MRANASVCACVHACARACVRACALLLLPASLRHVARPVYPHERVKEEHGNGDERDEKRPEEQPIDDRRQPVPVSRVVGLSLRRRRRRRRRSPPLPVLLPHDVSALPRPRAHRPDVPVHLPVALTRSRPLETTVGVHPFGGQERLIGGRGAVCPHDRGPRARAVVRGDRGTASLAGGRGAALAEETREVVQEDEVRPARHRAVRELVQVQHEHREHH